jgi:hypothetical protein
LDSCIETGWIFVGEGWEASCGPQLASQKAVIVGIADVSDGSGRGKWIKFSKELPALVENSNPKSIVDKM